MLFALELRPLDQPALVLPGAAPKSETKDSVFGDFDPIRPLFQPGRWKSRTPRTRERAPRRAPLTKYIIAGHRLGGLRLTGRTGTILGTRIDGAALGDMTARVLPTFADVVPVKTQL